jgi:hypothetical protein
MFFSLYGLVFSLHFLGAMIGVDRRDDCSNGALPFPLWRHCDLSGGASRIEISGKQRSGSKGKSEVRA